MNRLVVIAAMSMAALAACGDSTTPEAQPGPVETDGFLFPWELAAEQDEVDVEINRLLQEFRDSEIAFADCVSAEGYDYAPRSVVAEFGTEDNELLTQAQRLQRFGYGIVQGEASSGFSVTIDGGTVADDQVQNFDEYVLNDGPCMSSRFNRDIQFEIGELQGAAPNIPERVLADSEFVDAQGAWFTCMSERGFNYRDPSQAFDDIESSLINLDPESDNYLAELAELAELEVEIATADLECFILEVDPVLRRLMSEG